MSEVVARRCPICVRAADEKFHPFCSRRCADIDLGRWLKGGYAIPAEDQTDEEEVGEDRGIDDPAQSDR